MNLIGFWVHKLFLPFSMWTGLYDRNGFLCGNKVNYIHERSSGRSIGHDQNVHHNSIQ